MAEQKRPYLYEESSEPFFQMDIKKDKVARYLHVALNTLSLEALNPQSSWKIVDLAQRSEVSRTWIYENFGKNHEQILKLATEIVCKELNSISEKRTEIREKFGSLGNILRSRKIFRLYPEVILFYYRYRLDQGEVGEIIRASEKDLVKLLEKVTKFQGHTLVEFLALSHGLSTALFLTDEQVSECFNKRMADYKV